MNDNQEPLPPLKRVECVSFPRCGHHVVERMLRQYFGDDRFRYCDLYVDPHNSLDLNSTTNFQKNHDFELTTPIRGDRQYLVLFRDPRESIVSWFRLKVRKGEVEYTYDAWEEFARNAWLYCGGFFSKWVVRDVRRRLIIDYDVLIESPELMLSELVEFMSHRPACVDTCREIVSAERIQRKSRTPLFKFGQSAGLEHPSLR